MLLSADTSVVPFTRDVEAGRSIRTSSDAEPDASSMRDHEGFAHVA